MDLLNHFVALYNLNVGFVIFTCQQNTVKKLARNIINIVVALDVIFQPQMNHLLIYLTMVGTTNHFLKNIITLKQKFRNNLDPILRILLRILHLM